MAAFVGAVGLAPAFAADDPSVTHGFLNAQRAANALPAVAFSAAGSRGCDLHNRYMKLNDVLDHGETPGRPGYTPAGASGIGSEVLSFTEAGWSPSTTPWDTAPLHYLLLFDPRATEAGGRMSHGYGCHRLAGSRSFPAPTAFSYPGDGRLGVPATVVVEEAPYAPQTLVGIPDGKPTGPQIALWLLPGEGEDLDAAPFPGAVVESAILSGPSGPVESRIVDSRTPTPGGGPSFFRDSALVIPLVPLAHGAHYSLAATWRDRFGRAVSQSVSFKTAPRPRRKRLKLTLSRRLGSGRKAKLRAPAAAIGRIAGLSLQQMRPRCRGRAPSCRSLVLAGRPKVSSIVVARTKTPIRVPRPKFAGGRVAVSVRTTPFETPGFEWTGAVASRIYR